MPNYFCISSNTSCKKLVHASVVTLVALLVDILELYIYHKMECGVQPIASKMVCTSLNLGFLVIEWVDLSLNFNDTDPSPGATIFMAMVCVLEFVLFCFEGYRLVSVLNRNRQESTSTVAAQDLEVGL
jgi:hypothetical protein